MGNASSLSMIRHCLGAEVAPSVVKCLAGATQQIIEDVVAKIKGLGTVPGLSTVEIAQVLGEGRGCYAEQLVVIMGPKTSRRIDAYEMLAVMIMFAKTPARFKIRNLFDMFDLDLDGKLSSAETILMLRSLLVAIAKSTGGVLPTIPGIEDIWYHIVRSGFTERGELILFTQWIMFCSKTREVHVLGKTLDFNRGACRKAFLTGSRAALPAIVIGDEDSDSAAAGTRLQARTPLFRHQKQTAAAKEGRKGFSRSTALKIKEMFDSIDKEGSGYVDERQWRSLTKDTPLAASSDTSLFVERERIGKISIVEALSEVYPFASDVDLARMLQWISEGSSLQGAGRLLGRELVAERVEMALLFQTYDTEGNGEMTLGEVSKALADTAGLRKEDVMPMFLHPARAEEDYITASEFVDTLMGFIDGDPCIQSLSRSSC